MSDQERINELEKQVAQLTNIVRSLEPTRLKNGDITSQRTLTPSVSDEAFKTLFMHYYDCNTGEIVPCDNERADRNFHLVYRNLLIPLFPAPRRNKKGTYTIDHKALSEMSIAEFAIAKKLVADVCDMMYAAAQEADLINGDKGE